MDIGSGRQLAAVMFADVAGYMSLVQRGENAALEARRRHRAAVHEVIPLHGGRVVQFLCEVRWKNADPELHPRLAAGRRRIEALTPVERQP